MNTASLTPAMIASSPWAVPSLARREDFSLSLEDNQKIIKHIESGGIKTLLYGGNAIFYHLTLKQYEEALQLISTNASKSTWVIPATGPAYGSMLDQLPILQQFNFPSVMVLPQSDISTSLGLTRGIKAFAEKFGKPVVVYLKYDRKIKAEHVKSLVDDGLVAAIKYAVVRKDYTDDTYLKELCSLVDPSLILSGLGDQPAIVHMRDFHLGGFTTGCGCIAPKISMALLKAIQSQDYARADELRRMFLPLEDLRDNNGPIIVLHEATLAAGVAQTGPILPHLSEPDSSLSFRIQQASQDLMKLNNSLS